MWASPWFAAAIGVVCSLNTLSNGFTYDDTPIIAQNPRIRTLTDPAAIWLTDWWSEPSLDSGMVSPDRDRLYRPLTLFTFALNYAVGGLRPVGYHAVNVALHALCCALVFMLARRLFEDDLLAAVAALLFAVHPVHVEAIAGAVGRAELLSALLLLAGLLAMLSQRLPLGARMTLACTAFLGALLAKETGVCYFPVALLVLHFRRPPLTWRQWLILAGVLLIPVALYLPLRVYALGGHLIRTGGVGIEMNPLFIGGLNVLDRAIGAATILGHYARLFVAPIDLSCDYGLARIDPDAGATAMTWLGVLAAGLLVVGLLGYRAGSRDTHRRFALLCALFLASYALISNTVLLIGVTLAERLMYWPSVPLCMAVGVLACWLARRAGARARPHVFAGLGVALLLAFGVRTLTRNADWRDNRTLFGADARAHPESVQLSTALARMLLIRAAKSDSAAERAPLINEARTLLDGALSHMPRFARALRHRGEVELLTGHPDAARAYFQQALQLDPTDAQARGYVNQVSGEGPAKLAALQAAVDQRPDDVAARVALGRALLGGARAADGLVQLREAARLAPDDPDVIYALGEALAANVKRDEARQAFEHVLELRPDDWQAHTNLAGLLADTDPAAALAHAKRAHELAPQDWRTGYNLAEAYAVLGRKADAIAMLRETAAMLPKDHPAQPAIHKRITELERGG